MFNAIGRVFGMLLMWLYNLVGNYGVAIILFAVIVRLIMLPFQMKSKHGMMRMSRLAPKVKELEKKHGANQRKFQEEVSRLYKEEHCNPMSGCLWSLIPFPILIALYRAIRFPLTSVMGVAEELVAPGGAIASLIPASVTEGINQAYVQIAQSQYITAHFDEFKGLSERLVPIDYSFLGLNLGDQPKWNFFMHCDWSDVHDWLPALGLFLIPIISAVMSYLQMRLSQKMNPSAAMGETQQEQMQKQNQMMNLMMPLMSLWICFVMPAALGVYWIAGNVLAVIQEFVLNKHYGKILDREDAAREERDRLREAEIERKRQETERLKAEGVSERNENTSKKKLQAKQKAESDAVKAAAIREERAKRRERLGITDDDEDIPASQVGNRRYARGRAYVPDRFTNPENAQAATEAAAAESEFGEPIDETVPEAEDTAAEAEENAARTEEEAAEAENAAEEVDEGSFDDTEFVEESFADDPESGNE